MLDTNQLVARYVALWNEPDVDRRRQEIVALWTPDGLHYAKSHTCHGYCALEHRVTGSHERSIAPGLNLFRHAGNVDAHHNVVRFDWHMVRRRAATSLRPASSSSSSPTTDVSRPTIKFVEPDPR